MLTSSVLFNRDLLIWPDQLYMHYNCQHLVLLLNKYEFPHNTQHTTYYYPSKKYQLQWAIYTSWQVLCCSFTRSRQSFIIPSIAILILTPSHPVCQRIPFLGAKSFYFILQWLFNLIYRFSSCLSDILLCIVKVMARRWYVTCHKHTTGLQRRLCGAHNLTYGCAKVHPKCPLTCYCILRSLSAL